MDVTGTGKVAVVGAGLTGLATAAFAARAGHQVTVFDRSAAPGGRARSEPRDGFTLNLGPHALYQGGAAASALKDLGVAVTGKPPRTAGLALRGGRKYRLPAGVGSLLTTGLLGPREKLEAGRTLGEMARLNPASLGTVSLAGWLSGEVRSARVREVISAVFRLTTYVNAPALLSMGAAIAQYQQAMGSGVVYLDGGWQTLVDGLREAAEDAGARVVAEGRVERVSRPAGGWEITRAGQPPEQFDAVVLAAAPRDAATMSAEVAGLLGRVPAAIPVEAACLDIGLARLPNPRGSFALGIDEPVYLQTHSLYARLAPEGTALVSAAQYLPSGEGHDAALSRAMLQRALDLAQPGWREFVLFERFLPAMTVMHALPGAATGGLGGRPGPEVAGAPGLFMAGDWVGPDGLLADACFASARSASSLAARHVAERRRVPVANA